MQEQKLKRDLEAEKKADDEESIRIASKKDEAIASKKDETIAPEIHSCNIPYCSKIPPPSSSSKTECDHYPGMIQPRSPGSCILKYPLASLYRAAPTLSQVLFNAQEVLR